MMQESYNVEQVEAMVEAVVGELPEDDEPIDWEAIWDRVDGMEDPTRPSFDHDLGGRPRLYLPSDLTDPIFRTLKRRAKAARR